MVQVSMYWWWLCCCCCWRRSNFIIIIIISIKSSSLSSSFILIIIYHHNCHHHHHHHYWTISHYLVTIQRVFRGIRGRYKAQLAREARQEFLSNTPYALLIQQNVRAYISRLHHTNISKSIREMYIIRKQGITMIVDILIEMIIMMM